MFANEIASEFAGEPDYLRLLKTRSQNGISLLTLALLLLMIGGALVAGVGFLRGKIPAEIAAAQKEALAAADRAIIGFAALHHRLPCPAQNPGGAEDCSLSKGYLPVEALHLDAMLLTPEKQLIRYMAYRGAHDLATLGNTYEPPDRPKDKDENPLPPFGAENGLDMCANMGGAYGDFYKFVSTGFQHQGSASYAHYKKNGAPFNVAYGLALPGVYDADGESGPFDGVNADAKPEMEAPYRESGRGYDDFVFVRDLPSLMAALGCTSVPYRLAFPDAGPDPHVYEIKSAVTFATEVGNTIGMFDESYIDFINLISTDEDYDVGATVKVSYKESGIASPMLASVRSVAQARAVTDKAEKQRKSTEESADDAYIHGIISSTTAVIGNVVSTIKIIDNGIKIAAAVTKAIACLGLCANQYVAIGFYVVSIGLEASALGMNIAATVHTIQGTVRINTIRGRFTSDPGESAELCKGFEDTVKAGNDAIKAAREEQLKSMLQRVEATENARNTACGKASAVETSFKSCHDGLLDAGKQALADKYDPFLDKALVDDLRKAEENVRYFEDEIKQYEDRMNETNPDGQKGQENIEESIKAYRDLLLEQTDKSEAEIDPILAIERDCIVAQYRADYEEASGKKAESEQNRNEWQAKQQAAQQALDDAIDALPSDDELEDAIVGELQQGEEPAAEDQALLDTCKTANRYIQSEYWRVEYGSMPLLPDPQDRCHAEVQQSLCDNKYFVGVLAQCRRAQEEYDAAREEYEELQLELAKDGTEYDNPCAGGGVPFQVFPSNDADGILRVVDRKGVLK
jgi:type II secretory pathway pseudopilin PulG